ncbi:MAG: hypothetical protein ACPGKY_06570, partial [Nitrosopumilus sp.]
GDKLVENVNEKISEGITDTGDKLVENVNEKISEGITDTGDKLVENVNLESSTEVLVNEVSGFDPFSLFKNLFQIN